MNRGYGIDWTSVARLPWDLFAGTVDWMCRAAMPPGYFERFYGQGGRGGNNLDRGPGSESFYASGRYREQGGSRSSGTQFSDGAEADDAGGRSGDDLHGDDVKLVSYKVVFTKPGHERVMDSGEELISYNTSRAEFSGLKLAKAMNRSDIEHDDHKFIKVHVNVLRRYAKEHEDWDRRKVDLWERQVEVLESMKRQLATSSPKAA